MIDTVFPVRQGFPRAPDAGSPAQASAATTTPVSQAFAPAPTTSSLASEPTPPSRPSLPNLQAAPPAPVLAQVTPFNPLDQDVDLMTEVGPGGGGPTYVVGDTGSVATVTSESLRSYTVAQVTDYETGLPPTASTVNLRVDVVPGPPALTSYGVSLSGRILQFTGGAWIPPGTTPQRQVSLVGDYVLVIPNKDADGNPFGWPLVGPGPGTTAAIDVARTSSDVTTLLLGQVQDVVPSTDPLLDPDGFVVTDLPVQEVDVSQQVTTVGTPVDYFQSNHNP